MGEGVDYVNLWLLFWPLLAIGSFAGYVVASKSQGKKPSRSYMLLFFAALAVWLAVFLLVK